MESSAPTMENEIEQPEEWSTVRCKKLEEELSSKSRQQIREIAETGYFETKVGTILYKVKAAFYGHKNLECRTMIHAAVNFNHLNILQCVLKHIHEDDMYSVLEIPSLHRNNTALHNAALQGNVTACQYILAALPNNLQRLSLLKVYNRNGYSAVHVASYAGHQDVLTVMLDGLSPADIFSLLKDKTRKFRRHTALHRAAKRGHSKLIEVMLNKVGSPKDRLELLYIEDQECYTALNKAVKHKMVSTANVIQNAIIQATSMLTVEKVEAAHHDQQKSEIDSLNLQLNDFKLKHERMLKKMKRLQQTVSHDAAKAAHGHTSLSAPVGKTGVQCASAENLFEGTTSCSSEEDDEACDVEEELIRTPPGQKVTLKTITTPEADDKSFVLTRSADNSLATAKDHANGENNNHTDMHD